MINNDNELRYNITLLGESKVGKTSIISVLKGFQFEDVTLLTMGIDNFTQDAEINGKKCIFKIFDTAGQERYKSISTSIIKQSDGFLLVYAIDDKDSFDKINEWIQAIEDEVNLSNKAIYIVGNKIDIENRKITYEQGKKLSDDKNVDYFETSAKTGKGIKEVFQQIYEKIYNLNKDKQNKNKKLKIKKKKKIIGC